MKKLKRLLATVLTVITALSVTACGVGEGDPSTVQFYFWNSGYGVEYMQELVNSFNKKQNVYTVEFEYTSAQTSITSTLNAGTSNTYDLYLTPVGSEFYSIFECLDDVLSYKNEGESKTIGQKLDQDLLGSKTRSDGSVYDLTYGSSVVGLFYNKSIVDGETYKVPNTTSELEELVFELNSAGKVPFTHFSDSLNGYYSYLYEVWVAQYDGLDYYQNKFLTLTDSDGNSPSKDVFTAKDGRWEALNVLESIITKDTVTRDSNEQAFTTAQTSLFAEEAVMMVNGAWIKNEMQKTQMDHSLPGYSKNENIIMMKTPVISSIVEKLEDTDMKDSELSKIIEAIDADKNYEQTKTDTGISDLSENDYNRIKEARSIRYSSTGGQLLFIPNYSNAIEGAKEFIKYMFSDEGLLIWYDTTHLENCATLSDESKLDMSDWSEWDKYHWNLGKELNKSLVTSQNISDVFLKNGLDSFANTSFISEFCAGVNDRKNATEIWTTMVNKINNQWQYWIVA